MEDLRKTAREIGVMQLAANLWELRGSREVLSAAADYLPMPNGDMTERIDRIAAWLLSFGKTYYLFLTPEVALAEAMLRQASDAKTEVLFVLPSTMDADVAERIRGNLPRGGRVSVLTERDPLDDFFPRNTMMVVSGYLGRDHMMILEDDIYRLVEQHCGSFYGRKAFVPYAELDQAVRYEGWMELSREKINTVWRAE